MSHATTFYAGRDVISVDYTPSVNNAATGLDPMDHDTPIHPSYEDRAEVPDRAFFRLSRAQLAKQIQSWTRVYRHTSPRDCDLLHLHHLTPQYPAVRAAGCPNPMIGHLHGTELKMMQEMQARLRADTPDAPLLKMWIRTLRAWAQMTDRLVVVSHQDQDLATEFFPGVEVRRIGNGVDTAVFSPKATSIDERLDTWTHFLVTDPRGWDESGIPGSLRYSERQVRGAFLDPSGATRRVFIFVGRFLAFKRLTLLLEAFADACNGMAERPPLVVWGGFPGEWEGRHPATVADSLGLGNVFFAGWRGHSDLPRALASSDVFVAPAVGEPFGQVYLEAMASGLPVIAADSGGPAELVNFDAETGWLVRPDRRDALADALKAALGTEPDRLCSLGGAAREFVQARYSWDSVASEFIELYEDVLAQRGG